MRETDHKKIPSNRSWRVARRQGAESAAIAPIFNRASWKQRLRTVRIAYRYGGIVGQVPPTVHLDVDLKEESDVRLTVSIFAMWGLLWAAFSGYMTPDSCYQDAGVSPSVADSLPLNPLPFFVCAMAAMFLLVWVYTGKEK